MDQSQPAKWEPPRYRWAVAGRTVPSAPLWKVGRCWCAVPVVLVAAWWSFALPLRAEPPAALSEYQVKAVFLLNFLKYVEWPDRPNTSTNSPLEIVHVGDNSFSDEVAPLIKAKIIDGRAVLLKSSGAPKEWEGGHILFVSDTERRRLPEILQAVEGRPVLIVGESDGFLERGGMINFVMKEKKVRLEINLAAAEAAGLKISSRLLAVADAVERK